MNEEEVALSNGVTPSLCVQTVAVIPAYNETDTIGSVIGVTGTHVDRVVVINDGASVIEHASHTLLLKRGLSRLNEVMNPIKNTVEGKC
jgi:hypothetical protein